MISKKYVLHEDRNVSLMAYLQEADGEFGFSVRPAILVMPGGGYAMCSDREADAVALAYMKAGYQAFILRYTTKEKGLWPYPLQDYEEAMQMIIDHAKEWHVDPARIAAVGFSAGGHLTACAATVAEHKPAAAILVYPAILKDICDMCQPGMPYPHEHVDAYTSPCFIVAARDDRTVNIENELMMELALNRAGVPFESHIYSYGGHGFSTAEDWIVTNAITPRAKNWISDSIAWLGEVMGSFSRNGFSEPCSLISMNADTAPVLSITCSLGHLRKQGEEVQQLLQPTYAILEAVAKERGFLAELLIEALSANTLSEILEMAQAPKEMISELDRVLHGIINKIAGVQ